MRNYYLLFAVLVLTMGFGYAQAESVRFFVAASDVPIMDGLIEDHESGFIYDSPRGRIVESVAVLNQVSEQDVKNFYHQSLPMFGWRFLALDQFIRGKEILSIRIDDFEGQKVLTLSIAPRS